MEKIAAKQVEGVVDLNSTQVVAGRKQFDGGVGSSQGQTGHYPVIVAGFLYWVLDPNGAVQEGDFRLGVSPSTGMVALQKLTAGIWGNVCLDGCGTSTTSTGGGSTDTGGGTGGTGGTGGGTGGCLVYGTTIRLADGSTKNIEDLEIGDILKTVAIDGLDSADENAWKSFSTTIFNSTESSSTVVGIQKSQFSYYFLVNGNLKITLEHPMLIQRNGTYLFDRANDVHVGDILFDENGQWIEITSKVRVDETVNVVNINVESQDTYFANGYLIHNLIDPSIEKNLL
jgi:hypothetical protein